MALSPLSTYAEQFKTDLIALDPDGFGSLDEDLQNAIRDKMVTAYFGVVLQMLADADVSFIVGQFGGDDSAGDTPDNLTASGGSIT